MQLKRRPALRNSRNRLVWEIQRTRLPSFLFDDLDIGFGDLAQTGSEDV